MKKDQSFRVLWGQSNKVFTQQSQAHSQQQTMIQQQIHPLMAQQQQQMQTFMGLLSKK